MEGDPEGDNVISTLMRLNPIGAGRRRVTHTQPLPAQLMTLRQWQVKRLQRTHADLLASTRFGPACRFFLSDIYAPRDFSQRDQDMHQVYDSMHRFLPPRLSETLELLFELNTLTADLDRELLQVLVDEFEMTDSFTTADYAAAYRICGNYDERMRQIDLIGEIGRDVDWLVRQPLIGFALHLARGPAKLAGWSELHDFFERGFAAFKRMGDASPFLELIKQRERAILDRLFAGESEPFAI